LLVTLSLIVLSVSFPALAEKRVALVIGNGAYVKAPELPNPRNDAVAMADLLRRAGFDVVDAKLNLGVDATRRALRDFSDQVRDADIAIVFYAGHGMEMNGVNYLIPVDATIARDVDVEDEAISLDRVIRTLESARRLQLVILDSCRDNPFVRSMKRTIVSRSLLSGHGDIDERTLPPNTLIAYAQRAGATADDGTGNNSPYTTALLKHLATPGLDIELALRRVRDEVLNATHNRQEPFKYGSLGGAELPLVPTTTSAPALPASVAAPDMAERTWDRVRETRSVEALEMFSRQFSGTIYAVLARERIADLQRSSQPDTQSPPLSTKQTGNRDPAPIAPAPSCFEAPSAAPDVVIEACSKLLSNTKLSTSDLVRALNRRGLAFARTQRYKEALSDFDRLIANDKTNGGYFDNRQSVHRALGEYELALRDANETIRLDPDLAYGYHSRGNIYMDMKRYEQAVTDFTRAIAAKDPRLPKESHVWSIYDRGRAYTKLGRFDLAVKDFTTVLEQEPKAIWAHRQRGIAYIGAGQLDNGRTDLQTFLQQEPNDQEALQALATITERRPAEAVPSGRQLVASLANGSWAVGGTENCGIPRKHYSLEADEHAVTWRDGLGNADIESIVFSDVNELKTTTIKSMHGKGGGERQGTEWTYSRLGANEVRVRAKGKNEFILVRCK
jgi:uncharacterized caspase-like protein/tetratricopeptide (TPR) repeat protein